MKFFDWLKSIFWHAFFLNRLARSCSFMNSVWQSYSCDDRISELLWCQSLQFLSSWEAESWSFHSFRHCIAVFILSLKQIHDVSFLLKMKHFLNVIIICFFWNLIRMFLFSNNWSNFFFCASSEVFFMMFIKTIFLLSVIEIIIQFELKSFFVFVSACTAKHINWLLYAWIVCFLTFYKFLHDSAHIRWILL